MKRILVIGCPGAGKSVFSIKLNNVTGIPVVHLDNLYWKPDGSVIPKEEFLCRLKSELDKESWIIDGNYLSTMELRLSKCDTVFFFDLPTETCLEGICSRIGHTRPDIPWVEQEIDPEFGNFVRRYNADTRPTVESLLMKFSSLRIIRINSREQSDGFIDIIKNEQL